MAGTNNAVTKALEMLELLGGADQGLRLKAIAQQLGMPESTAHRLLASLVESGFAEQRDEHGEYSLGWKIVVLANAMGRDSRLVQMVRPYLEELVRQLGHTANLAVLSNLEVMYLDCQTPRRSMALYVASGLTLPVYATSLGKSMLTFQDEDVRDTLIDRLTFTPLTPNTVRSRSELMAALEEIRRHGCATSRSTSPAAPVTGPWVPSSSAPSPRSASLRRKRIFRAIGTRPTRSSSPLRLAPHRSSSSELLRSTRSDPHCDGRLAFLAQPSAVSTIFFHKLTICNS